MKSAFTYCRVSTTDQAIDGVSLAAQSAKAAAWCELNDCELVAEFCDAGLSGAKAYNRPELQAALDAVCEAGGVLVVYSLSRLARSTRDTIEIADRLERAGADLVSISERIDTTTAAGKMVFRMLAVMSEFERDVIAERTTTAMQHKIARGEYVGTVPFGYQLAADGVTLNEDTNEQEIISMIRELRGQGYSLRKIAAELDRQGIPTKQGASAWNAMTVRRICQAS